jgi:hypothetical protein
MNIRLALLRIYLPRFVRKRKLRELFEVTARAFGMEAPRPGGFPLRRCLERYARFTRERAEETIRRGDPVQEIEDRLFSGALEMGQTLRRQLRVTTPEEFMAACRLLYRGLGIDLRGDSDGEIVIRTCFFSSFYSGAVCRLISALDRGLASGLSGGGTLAFTRRITEEGGCCRAHIVFRENAS